MTIASKRGPNRAHNLPECGPILANTGGATSEKHRPTLPEPGGGGGANCGSNQTKFRPSHARNQAKFDRDRTNLAEPGPHLAEIEPNSAEIIRSLPKPQPERTEIGPKLTNTAQTWPKSGFGPSWVKPQVSPTPPERGGSLTL